MLLTRRSPFVCSQCARRLAASGLFRRRILSRDASIERRGFAATASTRRPFRVAIIGSGPAGFYAAHRLLQKIDDAVLDMYERLPVPFGLVRFGVAPDHPEVKNCREKFEEVASSPRFNFIGNVDVGREIPLSVMVPHYDAFLFAFGASKDKPLQVDGEDLPGVYSARAFVGWYNGLPEYAHLNPELKSGERAVVIGQGNVAIDVARILLSDVDALRKTDIAEHALEKLSRNRVKHVDIVGRRGPLQASFTTKEIRELMQLPSVDFTGMDPGGLLPETTTSLERPRKRIADLLKKKSAIANLHASKNWTLRFLLAPHSFHASRDDSSRLGQVRFTSTRYMEGDSPFQSNARVELTQDIVSLDADLAFRSIGYKSEPLPGFSALGIEFDQHRGVIPNDDGRVRAPADRGHLRGMYCAGWVKRGPTGVIASTMEDAFRSAENIADDRAGRRPFLNGDLEGGGYGDVRGWEAVREWAVRGGLRPVSWDDWRRIDVEERERGNARGKEREKFPSVAEMLKVLDA